MVKYKCGHESEAIILSSIEDEKFTMFLIWNQTVGYEGDRSKCWNCYYNEIKEMKRVRNKRR